MCKKKTLKKMFRGWVCYYVFQNIKMIKNLDKDNFERELDQVVQNTNSE